MPCKWMRKMGRKLANQPASHKPKRRRRTAKVALTEKLLRRQKGACYICGKPLALRDANLDHVIPKARGGSNHVRNLKATHIKCNESKADAYPYRP